MLKKNNSIEFWRFIFTVIVCFFHFSGSYFTGKSYFAGGYISVEFFFVLSGFLLISSYEKNESNPKIENSAFKNTIRRVGSLYPHYIFSFVILFFFEMIYKKESLIGIGLSLFHSIWEITMLQMAVIQSSIYNQPSWYVSALIVVGYFVYYLLANYKTIYIGLIAPLSIIIIYGFLSLKIGHVNAWMDNVMFLRIALFRAFAGISVGCLCYLAYVRLKVLPFNNKFLNVLDFFGTLCFCLVVYFTTINSHIAYNFISIALLAIAVSISFLGKGLIHKALDNRLSGYLGKISYPMFLNHVLVLRVFEILLPGKGVVMLPIYIIVTVLYSLLTFKLVTFLTSRFKVLITKIAMN